MRASTSHICQAEERNNRVVLRAQENLGMLLDLEKKIEGLIVFLSSDTQFIKDGPVVEVDPRCLRICLKPIKRNETQRHLFLVSSAQLKRSFMKLHRMIYLLSFLHLVVVTFLYLTDS